MKIQIKPLPEKEELEIYAYADELMSPVVSFKKEMCHERFMNETEFLNTPANFRMCVPFVILISLVLQL